MAITLRTVTGSALSYLQVDENFSSYFYSASISGSEILLHKTGSAAIGVLPSSSSLTLPLPSKWTDITNGIQRTSLVKVIGPFEQGASNVSATGLNSHAQGNNTSATNTGSHAEGFLSVASGLYAHAEGRQTQATNTGSHAEGYLAEATGQYSHAEGYNTAAIGSYSHAEGNETTAVGLYSHAEGDDTASSGSYSHAEGRLTTALGAWSHAEGYLTKAAEAYSHAEGSNTIALGEYSHAEGLGTVASGSYQHTQGQYNISSSAQSAFIIGNGTSNANRRNLVFASGSQFQVSGSLNVSGAINTVGNLTVQGNITAEQYIVSTSVYYVTESFSSGSHIFGNSADDTHQFTGSVLVNGSTRITDNLTVTGSTTFTGPVTMGTSVSNGSLAITANQPYLLLTRANGDSSININAGDTTTSGSVDYFGSKFLEVNSNQSMKLSTTRKERITIDSTGGIIINSGSQATAPTVLQVTGSTSLSGSLAINNGFDFIAHGNKQFNHGMFFHTASIAVANGTSGSALLSTTAVANGVSITSGSRITIANPGYYNIQFSAQLAQGAAPGGGVDYNLWFKKNGTNVDNSNSVKTLLANTNQIMTVDIIDYASNAGDYYEIAHQSDNTNSTLEYIAASGNIPATPSIIVTVQQVR